MTQGTAAPRTLAGLIRRAPRRGARAAQWYFLLFSMLCIVSAAGAVVLEPAPTPWRAAGLAFVGVVAALRVAEYRRGGPLPWPADLAEIAGVALLVAALGLQPARSMLFGCLMFRAIVGRLPRMLTLQAGFIAVLLGAAAVEDLDGSAVGGDITGMLLTPAALYVLRVLLLSGERDRERQQVRLDHLAGHDPLTGLPNRRQLGRWIAAAGPVTVLQIGLDRFSAVNESLGRSAGDQVLIVAASRIQEALGPADRAARLDGDEFAVLIDGDDAAHVRNVVAGITTRLNQPIWVADRPVRCGASVGVATAAGGDLGDPLRDADLAMYAAKSAGGNRVQAFTPELRDEVIERVQLEDDLRGAVQRGDLTAYFQPIVDLRTGRMRAVEALARWHHPRLGAVPPDQFIPLAESGGLIDALGEQMLRQACARAAGTPGCRWDVSVNVAPAQLRAGTFPDMVLQVLAATGLAADRLILEITESMLNEDDEVLARLERLRGHGVRVAVDDFGTGYSCLARLDSLPVDILKIDKSLLHRVRPDGAAPLVDAAIALAHGLGLRVVVEGVETEEQARYLRGHGCDSAQGYLYARPCPWDALPLPVTADAA